MSEVSSAAGAKAVVVARGGGCPDWMQLRHDSQTETRRNRRRSAPARCAGWEAEVGCVEGFSGALATRE
jgi:hypothetical protein